MASSSTVSNHKSFTYDVFLSFRGEDTRTTFIDHLYNAFQQQNIYVYKDDEAIRKGKKISDELSGSIEDSKLYIIVFSKNYASSSWCLDELVRIMECHKTTEHTAFPVFYDVEPTEVRKQNRAKHKNHEAAGKWKEALKEAADLAGWEFKNTANEHEAEFIQIIVEEVSLQLHSIDFNVNEKLVGMETRVKDVISALETSTDDVRIIGIKGMGGGGKTTLARAVFDRISFQFEGKIFVENVREEVSKASSSALASLQQKVMSHVLNQKIKVTSVHDGKNMMKKMMRGRKVLVVLDDVDHIEQLKALAGEPDWFKSGSTIIITTRDEQVLISHLVKLIFDVNLLSSKEANCLFSRCAFEREIPIEGYEKLSQEVVRYAAGLPLTIIVLGSFLCGKNESEWVDALERLKTIPLDETLKKLELSYHSLEEDQKEIFLNLACILKGWSEDLVVQALESCGFHAIIGLKVLQQKSLITISHDYECGYERVGMHDHLEEMGINIVRRLHPDKPEKHSRLWINEEIKDLLDNDLGTKATRYIRFCVGNANLEMFMKSIRKMTKLRFLQMSPDLKDNLLIEMNNDNSPYFPNALQFLHWFQYPFWSLPNTFQGNNLVALNMAHSKIIQLWEGGERKVLNKLKFLDLSYSKLATLDLGLIPNIEALSLKGCRGLVQLHMPVKCLKLIRVDLSHSNLNTVDLRLAVNLKWLHLKDCNALEELHLPYGCLKLTYLNCKSSKLRAIDIGPTPHLEMLILDECNDLEELNMVGERLNLIALNLSDTYMKTIDLTSAVNLERIILNNCHALEELLLPDGCLKLIYLNCKSSKLRTLNIGSAPNLEILNLNACNDLVELNMPVECLNLISVDLSHSKLKTVDLHSAVNLKRLQLKACSALEELHLRDGCQKLTYLDCSSSKLWTLDIRLALNLETLILDECQNLVELNLPGEYLILIFDDISHSKFNLPMVVGRFECLEELSLSSEKIKHLPDSICLLKHLKSLKLSSCRLLEKLPKDLGRLETLEKLTLSYTKIKHLPDSICMLKHLKYLELTKCEMLEKLPKDLGRLECLEELSLSCEKIKHLPDSICMLKHLKSLQLSSCWLLEKLPRDLGRLETLEKLTLSHTKIEHFPDNICLLKHLKSLQVKSLQLKDSRLLQKLPRDLSRLEELSLSSEKIKHLPNSICMLKHLKSLELTNCEMLEKLPEDLGRLEYLEKLSVSCEKIKYLPDSICMLKHLKSLELNRCKLLEKLPEDLDLLVYLEEFSLSYTEIKHLPDSICMFKHLKSLRLSSCWLLEKLPEYLGRLECLEKLSLSCEKIKHLPDSICMLKHLKSLNLNHCSLLEKLPNDLGRLESLEYLDLSKCELLGDIPHNICNMKCLKWLDTNGTGISRLPHNIRLLKGLRITGSRALLELYGFTSMKRTIRESCYVVL